MQEPLEAPSLRIPLLRNLFHWNNVKKWCDKVDDRLLALDERLDKLESHVAEPDDSAVSLPFLRFLRTAQQVCPLIKSPTINQRLPCRTALAAALSKLLKLTFHELFGCSSGENMKY